MPISVPRRGSCFKSKSEYVTEELGMCCCNTEKRTKIHVKNVMMMVLRGLKRKSDGVEVCEGPEICPILSRLHRQRKYDWFERSWQSW